MTIDAGMLEHPSGRDSLLAWLETIEAEITTLKASPEKADLNAFQRKLVEFHQEVKQTLDLDVKGDVGAGSTVGGGSVSAENIADRDVIDNRTSISAPNANIFLPGQVQESTQAAHKAKAADAEEAYLRGMLHACRKMSLGGTTPVESDATQRQTIVSLDDAYVALNLLPSAEVEPVQRRPEATVARKGEAPSHISALDAVRHNETMVLLGEPGSGKSTFVNYLAMCLAGARLEPEAEWLDRLKSPGYQNGKAAWQHGKLLPVRVVLRDFAASLPAKAKMNTADWLWSHIRTDLSKRGLDDYAPKLLRALRNGQCMVLLDGLDEVPDATRRGQVRDAVAAFAENYHRSRYLVTCRVLSYGDPAWHLKDFPTGRLAPFDEEQIVAFISAWYATLAQQERLPKEVADARAAELREAAIYLRDLAQNPMLLTLMATIHTFQGTLPYERARLYHESANLLLWRWQQTKYVAGAEWETRIEKQLDTRRERLFNGLCELAWKAHSEQAERDGAADLPAKDVLDVLQGYLGNDWGKAQDYCRYVEERAGLLVGRGIRDGKKSEQEAVYAFPHRTFQEYLAGCYLTGRREFTRKVADLVAEGDRWHEVVLLAAGHFVFNNNNVTDPLDAVNVLCPDETPTDKAGWRAVWWAGEILSIVGAEAAAQDTVGKKVLPNVCGYLVSLLKGGHLSPVQRVQAADALGRLGDPRGGVCTLEPAMVKIRGGRFKMGEGDEQRDVTLHPFKLSRYPVTNAQFWNFIDGDGYEERRYWTEEGWAWRQRNVADLAGFTSDLRWGIANRPVVGVNWHEASAYARWLSEETNKPYRLPKEAEWERAAAGLEGRRYPWGKEWQDGMANTQEANIGHTSAVGSFPRDATPEGIYDMGGNTWEWTLDAKGGTGKPRERVLRGGACSNSHLLACCTFRNWAEPNSRAPYIGFRLALSDEKPALPTPVKAD